MNKSTDALHRATLGTCLLSTLVLTPLDAAASETCAASLELADVSVVIDELPDPVYVHTLSKSEISLLESKSSGHLREALGLTVVQAGGVQTHITEAQAQSGAVCAVVDSVRILPMKEIIVYVASEYAVGSCNFDMVRRHEDEHVAIARRLVTEHRPRFVRAMTELRGENVSTSVIASKVRSAVQEVVDELQQAMRDANRLLDQRDTARTLRKCTSW